MQESLFRLGRGTGLGEGHRRIHFLVHFSFNCCDVGLGGALVVEQYVLTNPALNYAGFLLRAVMPTTLHVVIGIATAYAIGTEFSRRSRRAWLRCAGGSPLIALAGKLLPLFALFFALLGIEALILHAGFELPYRGNQLMMDNGPISCRVSR